MPPAGDGFGGRSDSEPDTPTGETRAMLLRDGQDQLAAADVPDAPRDARLLLRWAAGLSGAALSAEMSAVATPEEARAFRDAITRRATRVPLSHITGTRLFWDRAFRVTSDVLDPRPETETLIAEALNQGPFHRILDLGTGTGCLAITLLAEWPRARAVATDLSPAALTVASENADRHGVADRLTPVQSDWWAALEPDPAGFDLIVSNPPYITADEMEDLSPEVRGHEPQLALTPGGDGLDAYRAILNGIHAHAAPGCLVLFEIGAGQAMEVSALCASHGLTVRMIIPDLDQRPRVVMAET